MSGTLSFDITTKNSQLDELASQYANGIIYCYPRPSNGIIPSAETLDPGVAHCLILSKDGLAFTGGSAANAFNFGSASAGSISDDGNSYSGLGISAATMAFFRLWNNDLTACIQGTIGVSNSVMTCTTTTTTVDGPVSLTSFTIDLE